MNTHYSIHSQLYIPPSMQYLSPSPTKQTSKTPNLCLFTTGLSVLGTDHKLLLLRVFDPKEHIPINGGVQTTFNLSENGYTGLNPNVNQHCVDTLPHAGLRSSIFLFTTGRIVGMCLNHSPSSQVSHIKICQESRTPPFSGHENSYKLLTLFAACH